MGTREKAVDVDFSGISLEEEVESQLKEAAVVSMGTEVSEEDMLNICALCDQVSTFVPPSISSCILFSECNSSITGQGFVACAASKPGGRLPCTCCHIRRKFGGGCSL